jgi:hypothetical protein
MPAFPHRGMVLEQDPEIREVVWPYGYTLRFSIENDMIYFHMVYKWQNRPF